MSKERRKMAKMLKTILSSALKSNPALHMGFLTGIYDTLKKDGESSLNNIIVRGINDQFYSKHYGFSNK